MATERDLSDDDLIAALRKQVAAWFSNVHLLEFEELLRRFKKAKSVDEADANRMDSLLQHIDGISDERDSVPVLLAVRDLWQIIRTKLITTKGEAK